MISELRDRVKTSGGAYITIEDYNKLQVEWIKRAKLDVSLNQLKADAISEMIGRMPAKGFDSEREKNNWIGDYIHDLEQTA
tara:strand:+ start:8148 stop:8390 length:243 start_codon:yes stop_codon:yes gene_type:complete